MSSGLEKLLYIGIGGAIGYFGYQYLQQRKQNPEGGDVEDEIARKLQKEIEYRDMVDQRARMLAARTGMY